MQTPAYVQLIRIGNCLLAVAGVLVGAIMTSGFKVNSSLVTTALGVFFICAGGNVVNDIVDRRADSIVHPDRPLPTGRVTIHAAIWAAVVVHILAIILIAVSDRLIGAIGLSALVLLAVYNFGVKHLPLVGNLLVAVLGGMTFLCGGIAVNRTAAFELPGPLAAAVFATLFHFVRELIKDVEDREGDMAIGGNSLAIWLGIRPTLWIALGVYIVLAVTTVVPFFLEWYGYGYLLIVVAVLNFPVMTLFMMALLRPTPLHLARVRQGLKVGMLVGLVALLIG